MYIENSKVQKQLSLAHSWHYVIMEIQSLDKVFSSPFYVMALVSLVQGKEETLQRGKIGIRAYYSWKLFYSTKENTAQEEPLLRLEIWIFMGRVRVWTFTLYVYIHFTFGAKIIVGQVKGSMSDKDLVSDDSEWIDISFWCSLRWSMFYAQ